jgi:flagella basal body P-ring formation protein FlgA
MMNWYRSGRATLHSRGQPATRTMRRLLAGAFAGAFFVSMPALAADYAAQARIYLDALVTKIPGDVEITFGEPDPRLTLAECAVAEPFVPPNARLWGKSNVGIRCIQGASWIAYIPINVRIFASSPVASRPLARGEIMGPDDFRLERIELTQWPPGELASPDQVNGRVVTRAIAIAEPLRRSALKQVPAIAPGDAVRVLISSGNFVVATDGKALTSAANGDGVQVTLVTGKTVWGTANPGKVVQIR